MFVDTTVANKGSLNVKKPSNEKNGPDEHKCLSSDSSGQDICWSSGKKVSECSGGAGTGAPPSNGEGQPTPNLSAQNHSHYGRASSGSAAHTLLNSRSESQWSPPESHRPARRIMTASDPDNMWDTFNSTASTLTSSTVTPVLKSPHGSATRRAQRPSPQPIALPPSTQGYPYSGREGQSQLGVSAPVYRDPAAALAAAQVKGMPLLNTVSAPAINSLQTSDASSEIGLSEARYSSVRGVPAGAARMPSVEQSDYEQSYPRGDSCNQTAEPHEYSASGPFVPRATRNGGRHHSLHREDEVNRSRSTSNSISYVSDRESPQHPSDSFSSSGGRHFVDPPTRHLTSQSQGSGGAGSTSGSRTGGDHTHAHSAHAAAALVASEGAKKPLTAAAVVTIEEDSASPRPCDRGESSSLRDVPMLLSPISAQPSDTVADRRRKKRPPSLFQVPSMSSPTPASPLTSTTTMPTLATKSEGAALAPPPESADYGLHKCQSLPISPSSVFTPTEIGPTSHFNGSSYSPRLSAAARMPFAGLSSLHSEASKSGTNPPQFMFTGLPRPQQSQSRLSTSQQAPPKRRRGPLVRLSHSKRELIAGAFRVSSDGCLTVRNFLLLNPKRIDDMELGSPCGLLEFSAASSPRLQPHSTTAHHCPRPPVDLEGEEARSPQSLAPPGGFNPNRSANSNASFTLQSAIMNTPYSPINYSMDSAFPTSAVRSRTNNSTTDGGGQLLLAARDLPVSPAGLPYPQFEATATEDSVRHERRRPPPQEFSPKVNSTAAFSPMAYGLESVIGGSLLLPYFDLTRARATVITSEGEVPRLPRNAVRHCDLDIKAPVGEGASASVFVALHKPTGRRLAVKRVDLTPLCLGREIGGNRFVANGANGKVQQLQHIVVRELQVLHLTYRSPFMVKVYNAFYLEESMALDIVMEFMHYGSVDHLTHDLQRHAREMNDRLQERRRLLDVDSPPGTEPTSATAPPPPELNAFSMPSSPYRLEGPIQTPPSQVITTPSGWGAHDLPRADSTDHVAHSDWDSVKSNATEDSYEEGCVVEELCGVAERLVAVVGEQLLRGVRDMHLRRYIHRDIKPGNVLVNEHGVVKLSDFGLSQRCDSSGKGIQNPNMLQPAVAITHCNTPVQGSTPSVRSLRADSPAQLPQPQPVHQSLHDMTMPPAGEGYRSDDGMDLQDAIHTSSNDSDDDKGAGPASSSSEDEGEDARCSGTDKYMSPERHRGEPNGMPGDIWAVGVTLAEFAVGEYPYDLQNTVDLFDKVHRLEMPIDFERFNAHRTVPLSAKFIDFVHLATLPDPRDRPTAQELLEHPFFRQWKSPFSLKEYLGSRLTVPSDMYKEEYWRARRAAARQQQQQLPQQPSVHSNN